jgi:hypothetical protein
VVVCLEQAEEVKAEGQMEMTEARTTTQTHLYRWDPETHLIAQGLGTPVESYRALAVQFHGLCELPLSPNAHALVSP